MPILPIFVLIFVVVCVIISQKMCYNMLFLTLTFSKKCAMIKAVIHSNGERAMIKIKTTQKVRR